MSQTDDFYSDLHCHPALRSLNIEKKTLWDTYDPRKSLKKVVNKQLNGKRGDLYDQSGFPKLTNGKVKLVYAALYPLEQGFMTNSSPIVEALNLPYNLTNLLARLVGAKPSSRHIRDLGLAGFIKYSTKRINYLKRQEYWEGFIAEYQAYQKENTTTTTIASRSVDEINRLYQDSSGRWKTGLGNVTPKTSGRYQIVDERWDQKIENDDTVYTVLTIEGFGILSQTKKGVPSRDHGTRLLSEQVIFERIQILKEKIPIFFITFSHHFSSGLCGHARSVPVAAQKLGILSQHFFRDRNFNELGKRVLLRLLSLEIVNGQWVYNPEKLGRRILIDVKHMSLKGRLTLYQIVKTYNQSNAGPPIPLIASHVGYSGISLSQMLLNVQRNHEELQPQTSPPITKYGREHRYNVWSINLSAEEIPIIVDSGGLIGISLEQNILGIPFSGEKIKKKDQPFFVQLVMNQILDMAKIYGGPKFWSHVMMGTDYDGLINPVDPYSSALFFQTLKRDLKVELERLDPAEKEEASLDQLDLDQVLNQLFFENAHHFLQRNFYALKVVPKKPVQV